MSFSLAAPLSDAGQPTSRILNRCSPADRSPIRMKSSAKYSRTSARVLAMALAVVTLVATRRQGRTVRWNTLRVSHVCIKNTMTVQRCGTDGLRCRDGTRGTSVELDNLSHSFLS